MGCRGLMGPTGATGSMGPTGPASIIAYGGRYEDAGGPLLLPAGKDVVVTLSEAISSNNITLGPNNITIDVPGDYQVNYTLILLSTTGTFGLNTAVQINGAYTEMSLFVPILLSSDTEIITITSIVTLEAGDILQLVLSSATDQTVLFGPGLNASISVLLLNEGV